GAAVTVKYVDTKGNVISDEAIKSGNVGDSYTTEQKTIDGYTFKEVQGNATGTFTDQAQTVTYVYTKKPVLGAAVTVKYVDTEGNVISDEAIKSGNVGDSYTTEQKTIDGYTFKEVQGNATGTFTDQAQTVTYVYTKKPVLGAAVTVKYVDTEGNVISDEAIKSGNVGDSYTTEQKTIDGYTFKEVQGNATGTFTDQAQTVTYVYTKKVLSELNLSSSSNSKTQFVSSKEQIKTLPQTGENSTFTFVVSILGSLLLGVGLVLSLLRTRKTK
ncbi:MucBP domain-containing protein, partial [Lactococcus lactis]|uniref:MucBP domain-containing protein n=1 Tax=Lactococcus lactis TaxID=1358 RepID=UPI003D27F18F